MTEQASESSRNQQLFLATMAFAVSFSVWGLISALAPHFKDIYHLTALQNSVMIAIPVILGSLLRIPMGILADRYGGRLIFTLLLAFAIIPVAGIALLRSYSSLLAFGFLMGAAGSSFAVGVSFASKWFPASQQGFALGIFGVGNIGQSIAVFFGPRLSDRFNCLAPNRGFRTTPADPTEQESAVTVDDRLRPWRRRRRTFDANHRRHSEWDSPARQFA